MHNWDDLRFCLALFRCGTMTDAARVLDTNVATVSRRIARMTEGLGQTLFVKEGQHWVPTAFGSQVAALAETTENEIIRSISGRAPGAPPDTQLRISCALQVLQSGVLEGLSDFMAANPSARLRILIIKQSLAMNECDLRIGFEVPSEGRLVRRALMQMEIVTVRHVSHPLPIEDWLQINYSELDYLPSERLRALLGRPPKVELEGLNIAMDALRAAPLLAAVPRAYLNLNPELVEVPLNLDPISLDVWLSYHDARRRDPIVRLAIEFLQEAFRKPAIQGPVAAIGE
ncbi:LysR family transcriptional regulator [Ovoidimarina sediminis]|uniref:LysR family transcriptional regulator n=1 Tax=Ovoidimarina sediminis TaxID=3079856 RepID=UPI0029145C4C|nr:LysR family transcriptional regulator [Rhodophyticola sp. MJ-SS7]MDU8942908.1 LysR family transcriptional regulator [Rhodophyticola sp. MJ-SS7]